jgi:Domain of unknown function (DUF4397)
VTRQWRLMSFGLGLLSLGAVLLTASCGSTKTQLRVMNAVVDEPNLDLLVDGTASATSIAYGTSDGYHSITSGSRHIQIEPSGTSSPLVDQNINFSSGTDTTIMAANFSSSITTLVLIDDNSAPPSGDIKLRIVNAAPSIGPADVYIVSPGTDINTTAPTLTNLAFGAASSYQSLSATNYEIIFTPTAQKFLLIDSGSESFTSGQVRTFVGLRIYASSRPELIPKCGDGETKAN